MAEGRPPAEPPEVGYCLRQMEPGDAPALFDMFEQPLCRQAMDMEPFGSPAELHAWLRRTGAGNFQSVVTWGGAAVAFAGLFLDRDAEIGTGWISLFVHDRHHRRGIGTLLMTVLIATAHVLDVGRMRLDVFCDNARAIALYEKFGFRIEARTDAYFLRRGSESLAAYTMTRIVAPGTPAHAATEHLCRNAVTAARVSAA